MKTLLQMLADNPRGWGNAPGPAPEIAFVDELGNGFGFNGQMVAPSNAGFQEQRSLADTAEGIATAPARMATGLLSSLMPYGEEGWQVPGLAQEAMSAISAPGRAYYEGMSPEEAQRTAASAAGFAMGGGGLAAGARGQMLAANASKGAGAGAALLDLYHRSPEIFDRFDPSKARTQSGVTYFSEGKPLDMDFGQHTYRAQVDPTGAKMLDTTLPFEKQSPEAQRILQENQSLIRQTWKPQRSGMMFDGKPYDPNNPQHVAAELLATIGDRDQLIQNLEQFPRRGAFDRLMRGDAVETKALDVVKNQGEAKYDLFPPGVPIDQLYTTHNFPMGLDKLGFDIAKNGDEIGLLNTDLIKHLYRDGEQLYANSSKSGALPALANALDMSPEARLARAKEMGFDTNKTWYHGTDKEFDKFDLGYAGSGDNAGNAERAAFFTDNPSVADSYLGKQYINAASPNAEKFVGSVDDGVKTVYGEGSRVLPVMVKGSDGLEVWDMGGGAYTPEFMKRALREAREANATGVMFENMRDPGLSSLGRPKASNVMAVFDPKNIRSVNAAFDPAKSDSADLLAANASKRAGAASVASQPNNQTDIMGLLSSLFARGRN